MKIAFFWFGFDGRYGKWNDGLSAAMKLIATDHEVRFADVNEVTIAQTLEWKPDVVLFWEAPCTIKGKDGDMYRSVMNLPFKKALLFAGGPVEITTCFGFDLYFVESKVNEDEFEALGLPWKRAFGVNTNIMRQRVIPKRYDGFLQATFADWKRHRLFAEALGEKGCVAGRLQEHDRAGYDACVEKKVMIYPELPADQVCKLINSAQAVVNTASYWGGGQRCTLEAMACGVPVVVMEDSPKNREFVEESGAGFVVKPEPQAIRDAIKEIEFLSTSDYEKGVAYVQSKWTPGHYAKALLEGIASIL